MSVYMLLMTNQKYKICLFMLIMVKIKLYCVKIKFSAPLGTAAGSHVYCEL
jgi:hypothetical protein